MSVTSWDMSTGLYAPQTYCIRQGKYYRCNLPGSSAGYYFVKIPPEELERYLGKGKTLAEAGSSELSSIPDTWKQILGTPATSADVKALVVMNDAEAVTGEKPTPDTTDYGQEPKYFTESTKFFVPNQGWFVDLPYSSNATPSAGVNPDATKRLAWSLVKGSNPPAVIPSNWCVPIDPCPKGVLCCTDPKGVKSPNEWNGPDSTPFDQYIANVKAEANRTTTYVGYGIGGFIALLILILIVWFLRRRGRRRYR